MNTLKPTTLIPAKHIGNDAVLEVDAHWTKSDTLALICHPNPKAGGTMNNKVVTTLYRFCKENGMDTVRFNYRGVGRSSGEIEYGNGEYLDSLCVLDWALKQTSAKVLWLAGFSFGGFIACRVADKVLTDRDVNLQKLTLIAPSVERNDLTGLKLPTDTLVIYGDQDEFVRPSSMADFADEFGIRSKVMTGASHFFHGRLSELKELIEK
ncbi:alpha/beta hydrolase [Moraxella nonliquefaciens]|uniref:alpha/beta hydrolase n=1 Tax=Moraxella nonliquefaciens TaxID=478 RepID=UPI001EF50830|nr:alpha/beta fold hydrolase [Moraxella nonliquefaciens]MCG7411061.1 alpha/beta fold hydrolase [Moraxella nonliquefaciens]MDI4497225.1 alpha/beta fold hydrolase [Moraxella nonliquefaciens]MDI4499160.1 alpha/beta fold hydrolase [Moraxella nonliquefaciens]